MPRLPNICIFCGKPGSSKQHIFPNRLRRIVPRVAKSHEQTRLYHSIHEPLAKVFIKEHNGNVGTKQTKKVCGSCNRGWMKSLEEEAWDVFSGLILGTRNTLDSSEARLLAGQASLIVANLDYDDEAYSAVTKEERAYVMNHCAPPPNWALFLGKTHSARWRGIRMRHFGMGLVVSPNSPPTRCNTQVCTFVVGELLVHGFSAHEGVLPPELIPNKVYANDLGLIMLTGTEPLDFRNCKVLTTEGIERVANYAVIAYEQLASRKSSSG